MAPWFSSWFIDHPRSVGETYFEHQRIALSFAKTLAIASFCCAVHALVPKLFEYTGSETIASLHDRMVKNRVRQAAASGEPQVEQTRRVAGI